MLPAACALAAALGTAIDARADDGPAFDLAPTNVTHLLTGDPLFAEPDPSWALGVGAHGGGVVGVAGLPMFGPTLGVSLRARFGLFAIEPRVDAALPQFFLVALPYAQVSVPVLFDRPVSVFRPFVGVGPTFAVGSFIGHVENPVVFTIPGAEAVAGIGIAALPHVELRAQTRFGVGVVLQEPRIPFGMLAGTVGAALTL